MLRREVGPAAPVTTPMPTAHTAGAAVAHRLHEPTHVCIIEDIGTRFLRRRPISLRPRWRCDDRSRPDGKYTWCPLLPKPLPLPSSKSLVRGHLVGLLRVARDLGQLSGARS